MNALRDCHRHRRARRLRRTWHRRQNPGGRATRALHKVPYLGLCLGMQVATIEFARNACGLAMTRTAPSSTSKHRIPVISLSGGAAQGRRAKGASMRLGVWPTKLEPRGLWPRRFMAARRSRNAIGIVMSSTTNIRDLMTEQRIGYRGNVAGRHAGRDDRNHRIIPWFLASQFHPEFLSKPNAPHPLFRGLFRSVLEAHQQLERRGVR